MHKRLSIYILYNNKKIKKIFFKFVGDNNFPKNPDGTLIYDYVPPIDTWRAMEQLVDEGLVKSIGVSNFNSSQVEDVSL